MKQTGKRPPPQDSTTTTAPGAQDGTTDRKERLANALRQRVVSMEWLPGALVDELALCEEFGLSRPPVRELMRQLAAEGYIELQANRPARVSPMNHELLRSFFQAAPMVYIATTQLAASEARAEDVRQLRQIQADFCAAIKNRDAAARVLHNDRFHRQIGLMARNIYLLPSLGRLLIDHSRIGRTFYRTQADAAMQQDMLEAAAQHEQMIEAIARHDVDAIAPLVRAHWELSRKRMAEYILPDGLDAFLQ